MPEDSLLIGVILFLTVALICALAYNLKLAQAVQKAHFYICKLRGVDEADLTPWDSILWMEDLWKDHLAPLFKELSKALKEIIEDRK